jgi:hypothetical protein
MPFLKEKEAVADAWKKRRGGKSAAGIAAAAVAVGGAALATEAGALSIVENVASYVINDDSSITVTFIDGTIATIEAGRYIINSGQITLLDPSGLLGGGAGLLALLALSGGTSTAAAVEGSTPVTTTPDPVIVHQAQDEGPDFDLTDDDIADEATEVEFGDKSVRSVELSGDDNLDVIDIDVVHDDATLDVTGLDGGDRVEIANDGTIEAIDLKLHDTAEVGSPLVVSLEGVTVNDKLQVEGAKAVEIEATGDGPTTLDRIQLSDLTEELSLTGDQHLTINSINGDDALTTIDASQASAGVTIGELNDPDAIDALTSFIGSSANDSLALDAIGDDVTINLGAGDDHLLLDTSDISGANVILAGPGADIVDLSDARVEDAGNTLTVDLGANDGDVDQLILGDDNANLRSNSADDNYVTVQNFEVGTDQLDLMAVSNPGVGVMASPGDLTHGVNIIQDVTVSSGDLTDKTAVSVALRNAGYEYDSSDDEAYVIVNDGTSSALYLLEDDGGANIASDGDEASLVAVFDGIADMSGLSASDVDFIA